MTDHINPTIYDDNMFNSYFQWDSDSAAPFDAIPIDGDIEMIGSSVLATSFCEKNSALANAEDANPRCETLADSPSCEKSDCDNAAAAGEEENLDLENPKLVTSQDSVCAPAAANSEESPEAILQACKASQDKAERNEDGSVEVASENLASAVICPSSPQRNSCRQLRPSRDIQPINRSPSSTPVKQRHTRRLRPSFGVQPVMSSTFTVMSSVKITSRPQSALNTVIDLTALDDSSSESDPSPRPGSRKRAAPKESLETAKRAKEYSEGMRLVLNRSDRLANEGNKSQCRRVLDLVGQQNLRLRNPGFSSTSSIRFSGSARRSSVMSTT